MFIKFKLEVGLGKKKGLRRLAGSSLTYEDAPPPQQAQVPQVPAFVREPRPPLARQPGPPVKSLRLRANMSVREVAKLLNDDRIREVIGETEAAFYERYAGGNYDMVELADYVGSTDEVGVRVYVERIENTIIREALGLKLIAQVEPPPQDHDAQYDQQLDDEARLVGKDFLKSDRRRRDGVGHGAGFEVKKQK